MIFIIKSIAPVRIPIQHETVGSLRFTCFFTTATWNPFKAALLRLIGQWISIVLFCHLRRRGTQCVNRKLSYLIGITPNSKSATCVNFCRLKGHSCDTDQRSFLWHSCDTGSEVILTTQIYGHTCTDLWIYMWHSFKGHSGDTGLEVILMTQIYWHTFDTGDWLYTYPSTSPSPGWLSPVAKASSGNSSSEDSALSSSSLSKAAEEDCL